MDKEATLIVGLGNPGQKYQRTRHNLGFRLLAGFAEKHGWVAREKKEIKGRLALGNWSEKKVALLFPTTYMNLSGVAVRKVASFYKVKQSNLLVISDDTTLDFGTFRYRSCGSAGGHNGLKNIEAQLGSAHYARLRAGVGAPQGWQELSDYGLSPFALDEEAAMPKLVECSVRWIERWLDADESGRAEAKTFTAC